MEIVLFIYLAGLIPAYLALRSALRRLNGIEGRTAADALLNVMCSLCSWITVIVVLVMMGILAVSDIEQKSTELS